MKSSDIVDLLVPTVKKKCGIYLSYPETNYESYILRVRSFIKTMCRKILVFSIFDRFSNLWSVFLVPPTQNVVGTGNVSVFESKFGAKSMKKKMDIFKIEKFQVFYDTQKY